MAGITSEVDGGLDGVVSGVGTGPVSGTTGGLDADVVPGTTGGLVAGDIGTVIGRDDVAVMGHVVTVVYVMVEVKVMGTVVVVRFDVMVVYVTNITVSFLVHGWKESSYRGKSLW